MRELLVVALGVFAGCAASPAAKQPDRQPTPPSPARRETAREDVAAGGTRPATVPTTHPARLSWRGLDLARAPVTSDPAKLTDIWEERPAGSKSYEIRADVTVIRPRHVLTDATVYWVRSRNRFYVQHDEPTSSTLHYYGPFTGDPHQVLKPPPAEDANR